MTAAEVANLTKPGRHLVERGLYLVVAPGGSRSWAQRVYLDGKRTDKGLGGYPLVGLLQARKLSDRNRAAVAAGQNPWAGKKKKMATVTEAPAAAPAEASVVSGLTFTQASIASIAENGKVGENTRYQRQQRLGKHVLPALGNQPVASITRSDVLDVLRQVRDEEDGRIFHETRHKALGEITAVLDWCEAYDHIEDNPARSAKVRHQVKQWGERPTVNHRKALHYTAIPGLLASLRDSEASSSTKDAVKLMILTAARPGEVSGMTWAEVDLDARVWSIPTERMKGSRPQPHRVPLSIQAYVLLSMRRNLKSYQPGGLVFPSPRKGKCLVPNTFSKLFRERNFGCHPHGCRSSFRDWAAEQSGASREPIEMSLAHVVAGKTERAYFRSDLLDQRRELLQSWADYVDPTVF